MSTIEIPFFTEEEYIDRKMETKEYDNRPAKIGLIGMHMGDIRLLDGTTVRVIISPVSSWLKIVYFDEFMEEVEAHFIPIWDTSGIVQTDIVHQSISRFSKKQIDKKHCTVFKEDEQ